MCLTSNKHYIHVKLAYSVWLGSKSQPKSVRKCEVGKDEFSKASIESKLRMGLYDMLQFRVCSHYLTYTWINLAFPLWHIPWNHLLSHNKCQHTCGLKSQTVIYLIFISQPSEFSNSFNHSFLLRLNWHSFSSNQGVLLAVTNTSKIGI